MKKVRLLLLLFVVAFLFSCKSAPKQKEEKPDEMEKIQQQESVKEEPDKKAEQKVISDDASYVIYFAPQAYQIDQFTAQKLKEIADDLKARGVKKIFISGHSAKLDSQKDEDRIALQRAIAVANYFQTMGLFDANGITVEGKGAREPASTHSEITDRFKNRRVEIHSVK
ncbi:OmpA family protein [Treponema putidum]|uniref:OmpA family protein n=1 Tax=Treponema putidum TaxID=221027 RepID=UPI0004F93460|nr:OmpA family protein [Treponema putidum]AIN94530.1 cell envelope biogenesis protein OmpA [Treponema putidum]TWI78874.1 outer membrane protein OmpA-like peptidoglycan-associated protein [Treponema putidum]